MSISLYGSLLDIDVGSRRVELRLAGHGWRARIWLLQRLVALRDEARARRGQGDAAVPVVPRSVSRLLDR